ncbi:MAG: ABC transporter ATP-binding protein [Phycisphaerales bacterium]|nr:ABC transporter ATP-binding protein [Phycisphaerales bacterium]
MTQLVPNPPTPPSAASTPLLTVEDLAISFDRPGSTPFRAVDGVSFAIHPQQTFAIVGESGSGKSVTALSILRLLAAPPAIYERGRITLHQRGASGSSGGAESNGGQIDLLSIPEPQLRQLRGSAIGMIFQEPMTSLNPVLTVGDQIAEAITLHQRLPKSQARTAAIAAMEQVGIREPIARYNAYPHQFSGGMRQRTMIAMALACQPTLLIADEPTTALDVTVQDQILNLLNDLKRDRGLGIILITHDLGLVADHADAVCVMYAGRVIEFGPTAEVLANPLHPYTKGLLACTPRIDAPRARLQTVEDFLARPEDCTLTHNNTPIQLWWPTHSAPTGATTPTPSLIQPTPTRWLAAWSTPSSAALKSTLPPSVHRLGHAERLHSSPQRGDGL